ncbi:unnamed protein product [Dracunculus medinensis]|uniref:Nodule Cysteine-Rich (NCR) secreted peptide n=1 Tax=Dracunculus medinensis TaxID=318479 RepID=A0A0N4US75_DRAME|nr:unnamed protein product [Dracunculus medinensis]
MFAIILPFSLLSLTFAGNVEIEECVKLVGDKKRPTVNSCPEDPVCSSIFVYEQGGAADLVNNLREYEFFKHYKLLVNDYNSLYYF